MPRLRGLVGRPMFMFRWGRLRASRLLLIARLWRQRRFIRGDIRVRSELQEKGLWYPTSRNGTKYGAPLFCCGDGFQMRLPWISFSSHVEMMGLVTSQLADLKAERQILL